eukprot:CAMPEP_0114539372 /NCGR_PEP_ID=MMETSP0114-20121206/202_1 /TAXON_ID=31324 /ORGANISM="Goniomonas sp, Strain m" /LENGTH=60 /DNA_ID=CAMNT_0001723469 /DNA_START=21 /DNA_END=203 /DNA_ORIENTATION=+
MKFSQLFGALSFVRMGQEEDKELGRGAGRRFLKAYSPPKEDKALKAARSNAIGSFMSHSF